MGSAAEDLWLELVRKKEAITQAQRAYLEKQCARRVWVQADGRHIAYADMAYEHINRVLNKIVRELADTHGVYLTSLQRELRRRSLKSKE